MARIPDTQAASGAVIASLQQGPGRAALRPSLEI